MNRIDHTSNDLGYNLSYKSDPGYLQMKTNMRSSVAFSVNTKLSFRVIIVGDSAVGKTSLIVKYVKGIFNKTYTVSLGVQFYSKIVNVQGQEVVLQIWDTAGQQNFKSIVKSFYNKASCVIIAYSHPELIQKTLEDYTLQINQHALDGVRVMVARTQIDQRPITESQSQMLNQYVKNEKIDLWMGVSSKTGQNVEQFFSKMGQFLHKCYMQNQHFREIVDPKKDSFKLKHDDAHEINITSKKEKKKCCQ